MMNSDSNRKRKKALYSPYSGEGKVLPQAVELEEGVLGALLLEDRIDTVSKDLTEELFYKEQNQIICRALLRLYRKNKKIDILTVCQDLKANSELELVGGSFYVSSLTNRIANSANIEYHIKILQQHALKRNVIRICTQAIGKAYDDTEDVFDLYSSLQTEADNSVKDVLHYDVASIGDLHGQNIQNSRRILEMGGMSGVESGLDLLDDITSGWQKSDLIILAGRPSMGKTASAISMIVHPAIEKEIPVAVFTLEMSNAQITGRIQSLLSGVDVGKITKNKLDAGDIEYIDKSCAKLATAPLFIDDTPNISLTELKSKARKLHREKGIKLIIIDYLQLMRSGMNISNREQEVAEISKGLKVLSKELDIPIIALSQMSRQTDNRADKKPLLSDLRESGQIEQDADIVLFCFRPEYYGAEEYELEGQNISAKGLFVLIIAKHRNGELGDIPLRFIHSLAKVTNHPDHRSQNTRSAPTTQSVQSENVNYGEGVAQNNDFLSQKPDRPYINTDQFKKEDEVDLPF